MRITLSLIVACVFGAMLGCGQKGPLVLPDAPHPHKKIGIGKPAQHPPAPGAQPPATQAPASTSSPTSGGPAPASGVAASSPQP